MSESQARANACYRYIYVMLGTFAVYWRSLSFRLSFRRGQCSWGGSESSDPWILHRSFLICRSTISSLRLVLLVHESSVRAYLRRIFTKFLCPNGDIFYAVTNYFRDVSNTVSITVSLPGLRPKGIYF
jgi:hypothetical protein